MSTIRPGAFDDRYGQTLEATRRGAHRARPALFASLLPAAAVVAVVGLAVATTWTLFGDGLPGGDGSSSVAGAETSSSPSVTPVDPAVTPPVTASPSAIPTTEAPPAPAVDPSATVNVLNNTSTAGLARTASQTLADEGWTIGEVGDFLPRDTLTTSTVYYPSVAESATAAAVAAVLGAAVEESAANAKDGLVTVVLGPDFTP